MTGCPAQARGLTDMVTNVGAFFVGAEALEAGDVGKGTVDVGTVEVPGAKLNAQSLHGLFPRDFVTNGAEGGLRAATCERVPDEHTLGLASSDLVWIGN